MRTAEIIVIGNEILDGEVQDTNSVYISKELLSRGIKTRRKVVVGDSKSEIKEALRNAMKKPPDYLFLVGGIGITPDDVTKIAVAEFFRKKIFVDEKALERVKEVYKREPGEEKGYALIFDGSTPIYNPVGIGCGIKYRKGKSTIFILPGVPEELRAMFDGLKLAGRKIYRKKFILHGYESDYLELYKKIESTGCRVGSYPRKKKILLRIESGSKSALRKAEKIVESMKIGLNL